MKNKQIIILLISLFLLSIKTGFLFSHEQKSEQQPEGKEWGKILSELSPGYTFNVQAGIQNDIKFEDNKSRIELPQGAVEEGITIRAQKVDIICDEKKFRRMGAVHEFGPHGIVFKKPVLLTLPYEAPENYKEEFINLYYYDPEENAWQVTEKVSQDFENNTITARIHHFSFIAPGVGSYRIEEGLSNNANYFKSNNERVDLYKGTLFIDRVDLNFPGHGIDLLLESQFSSDNYYWNHRNKIDSWNHEDCEWENEIECLAPYKIGDGWRYKLPAFLYSTSGSFDSSYRYFTRDGNVYKINKLLITTMFFKAYNESVYFEGARWYKKRDDDPDNLYTFLLYIEIIPEKIVIECHVSGALSFLPELTSVKVFNPDGSIYKFYDPLGNDNGKGKIKSICDASEENYIHFTYNSAGFLSDIYDLYKNEQSPYCNLCRLPNRQFKFEYDCQKNTIIIKYRVKESGEYGKYKYLVKYVSGSGVFNYESPFDVTEFHRLNAGGTTIEKTCYDYGDLSDLKTVITYPSGGEAKYTYRTGCNRYYRKGYYIYFLGKPYVSNHVLKEGDNSSNNETKLTIYDYYNGQNDTDSWDSIFDKSEFKPFYWPFPIYPVQVVKTEILLKNKAGEIYTRKECLYGYENPGTEDLCFMGQTYMIEYEENKGTWTSTRMVVNEYENIVPEYYLVKKSRVYTGDSLSPESPGDFRYRILNSYDNYGQKIREKFETCDGEVKNTYWDYVYSPVTEALAPDYDSQFENSPYNNNYGFKELHGLGLLCGFVKVQDTHLKQEEYYKYDNNRNLIETAKKKASCNGNKEWIKTRYYYDDHDDDNGDGVEDYTNNLERIVYPEKNEILIEYEPEYMAFIEKDVQKIHPPVVTDHGTAHYLINEYNYDDRARLSNKRTYFTDSAKNIIPGYASYYTHYHYDALNRITRVYTSETEPGKKTPRTEYDYNDPDNTLTIYDSVGNKILKKFDGLDRLVLESHYKSQNNGSSFIQTSCKEISYHPVYTNKITKTLIYKGNSLSLNNSYALETGYDKSGRPVTTRVIHNNATVTGLSGITYNNSKNTVTEIRYKDDTSRFLKTEIKRDWSNNVVRIRKWESTDGTGSFTAEHYSCDYAGNMASMTNPAGEVITYQYNTLGQLECVNYPDGTSETTACDRNGNILQQKDRKGNTVEYTYDSINMLRTEKTYNPAGILTSTTEIDYGQYGIPIGIQEMDATGILYRKEYVYDGLAGLVEYYQYHQYVDADNYEKLYSIENIYDSAGQLDKTILRQGKGDSGTLIKALDYEPVDQDTLETNASVTSVWEYDGTTTQDRIARITKKFWGGIHTIEYGDDGEVNPGPYFTTTYSYNNLLQPKKITGTKTDQGDLLNLAYSYDYQGNVTKWKNGAITTYYDYDGLDRLVKEDNNENLLTPEAVYYYDCTGNRTGIDHTADGDYNDPGDKKYFYTDTDNKTRLTEIEDNTTSEWYFTYDKNGSIIQKDNSRGDDNEYWFYTYDEKNRLVKVEFTQTAGGDRTVIGGYAYDSDGLRIKKIEDGKTTLYIYRGQSILFEETFTTGDQDELDNEAFYAGREYNVDLDGMQLARYKGIYNSTLGEWEYELELFLLDHLCSRQVVCDKTGVIINGSADDLRYEAFGKCESGFSDHASYTGKKPDNDTGLYYFNARYYDPVTGRFITPDPNKDGVNWYVYCYNNPLRYKDQTGEIPIDTIADLIGLGYNIYRGIKGEEGAWVDVAFDFAMLLIPYGCAYYDEAFEAAIKFVEETFFGPKGLEALGTWVSRNMSMSDASRAYEVFISGTADEFRFNGVHFDGVIGSTLIDAKNKYPAFLMNTPSGAFIDDCWARGDLFDQAIRQLEAAMGNEIAWFIGDEATYKAIVLLFEELSIDGIDIYYYPME